jgi:hypothetical protein
MFFILRITSAQNNQSIIHGSYYRLDNLDSLMKNSLDSLRGKLIYYWISDDSINGIEFPVTIFKSFDSWTNDNFFRFVFGQNYTLNYSKSNCKLFHENGNYFYEKIIYRRDRIPRDSTIKVNVSLKNDTVLIDNKYFKKDLTGRIFQRFTGY